MLSGDQGLSQNGGLEMTNPKKTVTELVMDWLETRHGETLREAVWEADDGADLYMRRAAQTTEIVTALQVNKLEELIKDLLIEDMFVEFLIEHYINFPQILENLAQCHSEHVAARIL